MAEVPAPTPEEIAQERVRNYKGIGRAMLQGITFGFGDEIEAGLRSAVSPAKYRETLDQIQQDQAAFKQKHPVLGTTAELGGGFASAIPGVGGVVAKAPGLLRKGAALAKVGAIYGGVAGAGTSAPGLENRLKGAAYGAGIGAVATPLLAGGGKLIGGAGKLVAHGFGKTTVAGRQEHALEQLAKIFEDAGLTPDDVAQQVAARRAAGDADLVLGQFLGASGRQGLKAATTLPSSAKNEAFEALGRMKEGASGRLLATTERATGIQRQNVEDLAADLIAKQKARAAPLYAAVDRIGPMDLVSDEADAALGYLTRKMPRLTQDVMEYIAEEGIPMESLVDESGRLSPRYYDILKKRVDATLFGKARGSADDAAWVKMNRRQILQARDALLQGVDESVQAVTGQPTYKAAREAWAGDEEAKTALKLGRRAFSGAKTPDMIRAEIAGMSPSELELYRTSALDAYRTKLLNRTTSPVPLMRKNEAFRERLRAVFGSATDEIEAQVASEAQKLDFANALHGSDTAERLTGIVDQGFGPAVLGNLTAGRPGRATVELVSRTAGAGFRKVARDRAAETARALTAGVGKPADLDARLEALKGFLARAPGKTLAPASSRVSAGGRGLLARLGIGNASGQTGPGGLSMMSSMAGGVGGGAYGATQGDTPEARLKNALLYGVAGAGAGYLLGRGAERLGGVASVPRSAAAGLSDEAGALGKRDDGLTWDEWRKQRSLDQQRRALNKKPDRTMEESLAKYAKLDNAGLLRRHAELAKRLEKISQDPGWAGIKSRTISQAESHVYGLDGYVPDHRVSINNAAGRLIGAQKRDGRLMDEIERVLKHRGMSEDEIAWQSLEIMEGRTPGSSRPPDEAIPFPDEESTGHGFAPGLRDEGADTPDVRFDPEEPLPPEPEDALRTPPPGRHAPTVGTWLYEQLAKLKAAGRAPRLSGRGSRP